MIWRWFTTYATVVVAVSRDPEYESELTATRDEVAAVLSGVTEGILGGSLRFDEGDDAIVVAVPEEITLEIELELEDGDLSLELEMEWPYSEAEGSTRTTAEDFPGEDDALHTPVGAASGSQTLARFEVFQDKADEWRWRLRHNNGNVIATSGEGYTSKHNAQKGLLSVRRNAPEAEVVQDSPD